ncbi:hypothetical protein GOP47_0023207 [Adiantum capillus-veneris]|uniref:Tropinone reductase-like 3 n=1 Tax=Adiantum capillus-veneris TaxID=13818 RepID=A0A9D4U724_ADICA|nr:hypothetical protein GOP47_0023207 [Adiantum capillus-veneris]
MAATEIPKRIKGKVAVVTASTQGIGYAIARRLGLEGASVVISSRKQKNVDEAVQSLKELGIDVLGVACHVGNADHRKNLIKSAVDKFGRLDIFVSNAAVSPSTDPILTMSEGALDKLWDINVKAGVLLIQEAAPHLAEGGSVILISSVAGYNPQGHLAMYGVTKTALFGLTKALAAELAPNVRVNCVAPGFVHTHLSDFIFQHEATKEEVKSHTLLDRFGKADDMAAAVAFLVSDDAAYITGEVLPVSGGIPSRL